MTAPMPGARSLAIPGVASPGSMPVSGPELDGPSEWAWPAWAETVAAADDRPHRDWLTRIAVLLAPR